MKSIKNVVDFEMICFSLVIESVVGRIWNFLCFNIFINQNYFWFGGSMVYCGE